MGEAPSLSAVEASSTVVEVDTVVIGAGAAGLAVGACLRRRGVPFVILEQTDRVGAVWHTHYDRLHLHTDKARSGLPYLPMPRSFSRYPSRRQVVAYLETYARHFHLEPRFGQRVVSTAVVEGDWQTRTPNACYRSRHVVVATGYAREPHVPAWPGQASFQGAVLHSTAYTNGQPFAGQDVLVVGFGNSGGEIAIDLWEHDARPSLAVRNPVNVIPRDVFGLPVLALGIALSKLPARLADAFSAPLMRLLVGDLTPYGLRKLPYGPIAQIKKDRRIPLLDIGTLRLIKEGHVRVHPGVERFTRDGVVFADGTQKRFEAVILATGYRPRVDAFLKTAAALDDQGAPRASGRETTVPGLYFCGFYVSPTGMLREISIEARAIGKAIAKMKKEGSLDGQATST